LSSVPPDISEEYINYVTTISFHIVSALQLTSHSTTDDTEQLTFKNRASYIQDGRTAILQKLHFIYFLTNISTEYFKHATHSPFFSSNCRLFHNATFFDSCIIHILPTGCAKITCKIPVPKVKKHWNNKFYFTVASCWFFQ
jgi:hypothetical protein